MGYAILHYRQAQLVDSAPTDHNILAVQQFLHIVVSGPPLVNRSAEANTQVRPCFWLCHQFFWLCHQADMYGSLAQSRLP